MPLPRLPDISLDTWIRDQQQQFERQISSLGEATEFNDAVSDIESQVPADYPHPGGSDQWAEAQQQQQEEEYRRQQQEDERRQAEENQRQLEAYLNEKMRYEQEQQAQAQQDALLQQTQQAGITSPDQAFEEFRAVKPGDIPRPVQDFHSFADQIEQGQLPAGMEEMAARPQSPSPPRGVPSAYDVAPQIGQQAPPPLEEPAPRRGVPSAYDVAPRQEPPSVERPYWTPTAREQEGMGAPKGPEWLPDAARQIGGVVTKAGLAAARAEPKETITLPTGREVGVPGWAQQAVGSFAAASEPINAAQDYASARIDPQTWYFARDGIARTELEPGELDRWNELQGSIASSGFAGPTKSTWTPEEAAEIQRTTDKIDRIYQSIKNDPDKLTDYAEASPAYRAVQMTTGVVLGGALGNVAGGAAGAGARALGAGPRVARAASYAADIAAQTAFDPTTPAIQPLGDIGLRGIGAGVRGGRSLLGRAGRALEASADEIPTGTERLGSGFQTAMDMEADPAFAGMRPRVIPTDVARQLDYFPLNVPTDPEVIKAVRRAGGTVDEHGVTVNTIRMQGPEAAGGLATRGGTFHTAGSPGAESMYAKSTSSATDVGGNQRIEGETTFRNPLVLPAAPGDGPGFDEAMRTLNVRRPSTPEDIARLERNIRSVETKVAAWARSADESPYAASAMREDQVRLDRYRRDLEDARAGRGRPIRSTQISDEIREARTVGREGSPERAQALKDLLTRYGGDPDLVDELLTIRGADASESAWAIRENIVTAQARKNRHDGVLALTKAVDDEGKEISELVDPRAGRNPTPGHPTADMNRIQQALADNETALDELNARWNDEKTTAVERVDIRNKSYALEDEMRDLRQELRRVTPGRPGYELRPDIPAPEGVRRSTIVENSRVMEREGAIQEAQQRYDTALAEESRIGAELRGSVGKPPEIRRALYQEKLRAQSEVQDAWEQVSQARNAPGGGEPRWMTALGSGVSARARAPLFNAAQGGFFGAASENLEAQQEGREVDPATQLQRTLIGGGLGLLAGSRGARRLGGRTLQRLGSGVVPEGGRAVDSTGMIQGIRQIRAAGAADDAVLNAERHVAEQTNMTLDEIQRLTRDAPAVTPVDPIRLPRDLYDELMVTEVENLVDSDVGLEARKLMEHLPQAKPTTRRGQVTSYTVQLDDDSLYALERALDNTVDTLDDQVQAGADVETRSLLRQARTQQAAVRKILGERRAIPAVADEAVNPWEPTAAERAEVARQDAEVAGRPAHGGYLPEDELDEAEIVSRETTMLEQPPRAGEEVASEVAAAENIIPEDLSQGYLPGMRPRTRRPSVAQRAEATVDEMREGVRDRYQAERTPFKLDDIWARAAAMRRTTPEKLRAVFEQAQTQRGDEAAVAGTAMRQEAAALGEQTRLATEDTLRAKKALDDELLNRDIDPTNLAERQKALKGEDPVLNGLADELEASMQAEAASIADFEAWQKGDFSRRSSAALELRSTQNKVSARQAYRQLKANRSFFAEMEATAAEILAKGENMTDGDWTKLRSIQEKIGRKSGSGELLDEVTGRRVRDIEREGIAGVRKARGATDKPLAAAAEETLAERYGRLARRFDELNAEGDTDAAQTIRSMLDDTVDEIKLAADERAMGILNRELKPGLSPEEGMKAIQKAIGDKIVQHENRAALAAADVREGPGGVNLSMKQWRDLQKLQTAFQNRIDKAFKAESNEQVRIALRKQMSDARYMMGRALDDPDFAPAVQEFRDRVEALRQQPGVGKTTGERLAKILDDAYVDQSAERAFTQSARDEVGLLQSRIRGIQQQLDEAIKNKDVPGAQARVNDLLQDMQDVGGVGKTAADKQRERLMRQNLQDIPVEDQSRLREAIATVDLDDPQSLRMVLDAMRNPTKWDTFRERLYKARLSNPWTWITNLSSNLLTAAGHLGLQNPLERAFGGEAAGGSAAAAKELWRARGEAGQRAWDVMKTGRSRQNMEQLASGDMSGLRREFTTEQGGMKGRMAALEHVLSTRPLEAMDQAVGHMVYQSEVGKLAQREADRLLKVDDVRVRDMTPEEARQSIMSDIWDHPEIMDKARAVRERVLLRERGNSGFENALRYIAAQRDPGLKAGTKDFARAAVMDFFLPFFNVPMNYARQGIQRAGGAPFYAVSGVKKLRAGDKVGAAEDFAKGTIGAAAMTTAVGLYASDSLTGPGPEDPGDRAIWLQTHQPYSVKDPLGNWHSYQGTPVAIPFAIVAGAGEGWERPGSTPIIGGEPMSRGAGLAWGAVSGAGRGIASQSFLQGLSQSMELVTNPNFSVGNAAQLGASMALTYGGAAGLSAGAPTLTGMAGFLASMTDRMERDAGRPSGKDAGEFFQNVGARAAARIPGARWNLDPRIDAYGQPVVNQRSFGIGTVDPYWRGPAPRPGDRISQDLGALGVGRPPAPEKITLEGMDVPLTIHEQREFDKSYGLAYREILDELEKDRAREQAKTGERPVYDAKFYTALRDEARKVAVEEMFAAIPEDELLRRLERSAALLEAAPQR